MKTHKYIGELSDWHGVKFQVCGSKDVGSGDTLVMITLNGKEVGWLENTDPEKGWIMIAGQSFEKTHKYTVEFAILSAYSRMLQNDFPDGNIPIGCLEPTKTLGSGVLTEERLRTYIENKHGIKKIKRLYMNQVKSGNATTLQKLQDEAILKVRGND